MAHQIRRGLNDTERLTVTFLDGEPAWCTDTKVLWIGDGVTPGGITYDSSFGHALSVACLSRLSPQFAFCTLF